MGCVTLEFHSNRAKIFFCLLRFPKQQFTNKCETRKSSPKKKNHSPVMRFSAGFPVFIFLQIYYSPLRALKPSIRRDFQCHDRDHQLNFLET